MTGPSFSSGDVISNRHLAIPLALALWLNHVYTDAYLSLMVPFAAMSRISIERQILALTDDQLEQFVREWTSHKKEYVEVQRFSGPGDKGRDVVGYLTKERHEGPWHNYQCKQYGRTLRTGLGLGEVGKVLYYSYCGEFTAPTRFFFVAPRGLHRDLKRYIAKPSEFKAALVATWDQNCSKTIIEGQIISLSSALLAFFDQWDFSEGHSRRFDRITAT